MADGTIARLNVAIQADSSRFRRGMDDATKSARGFASTLKGIGVATIIGAAITALYKLVSMTSEASNSIDKLAKTSAKLGLTVSELQRIQFAGEQSGVAAEKLNTAFQRLTRRSSEAAHGTGEARAAFLELGIAADKFVNLSAEQKLLLLSERFDNLKTQADKVRVAFKLFDTEGVDLVNLLNSGTDGIKQLLNQQQKLGVLTQKEATFVEGANDAWNRLTKTYERANQVQAAATAKNRMALFNFLTDSILFLSGTTAEQLKLNEAEIESAKVNKAQAEALAKLNAQRERQKKLVEDAKQQAIDATKAARDLNEQFALQRETFGQDSRSQQIRSLELKGANRGQIEDLKYQAEKLRALEEQQKAQEALRDSMQEMIKRSKELGKAQTDPAEAYKKQILEIIAVSRAGLLTQEEYKRAIDKTRQQFVSDQLAGVRQSVGSIGSLNARERGSSSAFEAIDRFQKKPQDQLLKVQKESQKTLRNIDKNIAKGIKDGSIKVEEISL